MLHNSEMMTMGVIALLFAVAMLVAVAVSGSMEALLAAFAI